jgi:outer membrane protein assembly factor BamE (lipoprotein component of BamABCDE complex)
MLYFALVLAVLAAIVWYYTRQQQRSARVPAHRADYVMMDASSQAVLQMDPRGQARADSEEAPEPAHGPDLAPGPSPTPKPLADEQAPP